MDLKNLDIYKGKRVFLTGHTGFKGSWLLVWLHNLGAVVKGYALTPQNAEDLYNQVDGDSLCDSVIADIRDKDKLKNEIIDFQPDFIFHLAAQPIVRLSYDHPSYTFEVNSLGTAYLLDAIRQLTKQCSVVMITTDKVYENKEWLYPYRENDRLGGYDPYSASKATAELIINSYKNSFFNPNKYNDHKKAIATARAGNVIGGGDWSKDRIIPDIIKSLNSNKTIEVRNPKSIRPWQHVIEPLSGYLMLGNKLTQNPTKFADNWNFGPLLEDNFTVEDLVKEAIEIWGGGDYKNATLENQPHEARLLKLDINKAINELQWKPKWTAKKAIQETIAFYKDSSDDPRKYLLNQINSYVNGL